MLNIYLYPFLYYHIYYLFSIFANKSINIKYKQMKEITGTETSTIVVAGTWNKAIFTPEWVVQNVLELDNTEEVNIQVPMPTANHSLKFNVEDFSFYVVNDRLVFELLKKEDSSYSKMIKSLRFILRLLPHTPIYAFGINFVFESERTNKILDNINHSDFISLLKKDIKEKRLTLSFHFSETETLNIVTTHRENTTTYNYNFDYKVNKAIDISNIIQDDDIILNKKNLALDVQKNMFNENLE